MISHVLFRVSTPKEPFYYVAWQETTIGAKHNEKNSVKKELSCLQDLHRIPVLILFSKLLEEIYAGILVLAVEFPGYVCLYPPFLIGKT